MYQNFTHEPCSIPQQKKRKRQDNRSLFQMMLDSLTHMFDNGVGTSKHKDKTSGRGTGDKIYTYGTYHRYVAAARDFCNAMKEVDYKVNGHRPRTFEEATTFVQEYIHILEQRPGKCGREHTSPWTIHSRVSALAKVLGFNSSDYDMPKRSTNDIYRSRYEVESDEHFSEAKNSDFVTFCRVTGLRKFKELKQIRGTDLERREDGRFAIHVKGKGGLQRVAGLYGSEDEIALVINIMIAVGDRKVWPHVPSHADVHSYRAEYAARVYLAHARDTTMLSGRDLYRCRGEKLGILYDRRALRIVAEELGHHRESVVANHYMYKLDSLVINDSIR